MPTKEFKSRQDTSKNCVNVYFGNEEDRQCAINTLNGYSLKGYILTALEAKPISDPISKKRSADTDIEEERNASAKKCKTESNSRNDLTHLPYEDRLERKQDDMRNALQRFGNLIWKKCPALRTYIEGQRRIFQVPCELEAIRKSPVGNEYKTKCEFYVGKDKTGVIQVGYRLGGYVEELSEAKNISQRMKAVAKYYKQFLVKYNYEPYLGQFKHLIIRHSFNTEELMIVAGIQGKNLKQKKIKVIQDRIVNFFMKEEGQEAKVTSIYYDLSPSKKSVHLHGATHITGIVHGLKFRIGPKTILKQNTPEIEMLYQTVIDLAQLTDKITVLNICCESKMGIVFAKHCKSVVDVGYGNRQAIKDAKLNAKENDIENCTFFVGNAEHYLGSINVTTEDSDELLAILDPPRTGLSLRLIAQLRSTKGLNRLIYIARTPKRLSTARNWVDLVSPTTKNLLGNPFMLMKAIPVDTSPKTGYAELLLLFERKIDEDLEGVHEKKEKNKGPRRYTSGDKLKDESQEGISKEDTNRDEDKTVLDT